VVQTADGEVVTSAQGIDTGQRLSVRVAEGRLEVDVHSATPTSSSSTQEAAP
jgi:exonuclease VII large subunit